MALRFVEKIRYAREFNRFVDKTQADNPTWSSDECVAHAMDQMKQKYGASPDWAKIAEIVMQIVKMLLPFLLMADDYALPLGQTFSA